MDTPGGRYLLNSALSYMHGADASLAYSSLAGYAPDARSSGIGSSFQEGVEAISSI